MLKRLLLILSVILTPVVVQAQSVQDQIVSQLQDQGFTRIEVSRTLLGRVQLRALSDTLDREMIFNPATGEILRDSWTQRRTGKVVPRVANPNRERDNDRPRAAAGGQRATGGGDRAAPAPRKTGPSPRGRSARDDDDDDDDDRRGRGRGRGGDRDDDDDDDDDDRDRRDRDDDDDDD